MTQNDVKPVVLLLLCCGLSFLAASCSSLPDPEEPRYIGTPWGISGAGYTMSAEEAEFIDRTGVTWLRRGFYWRDVERTQGVYTWDRYDPYLDYVKDSERKMLVILAYSAPWVLIDGEPKRTVGAEHLDLWLTYVERTVLRYKNRVDAFEIWNEPNFFRFWKGSSNEFVALHRATVTKIREVAPDTRIISGGLWRVPSGFLTKLIQDGGLPEVDGVGIHPYALDAAGSGRLLNKARSILDSAELTEISIWVTEVGYPTEGWYLTKQDEAAYPAQVVKTMCYSIAAGAEVVNWYELYDSRLPEDVDDRWDSESFFGLAYKDFRLKPAWYAFSTVASLTNESWYRPDLVERGVGLPDGIQVHLFRRTSGESVLIIWSRYRLPRKVSVDFSGVPVAEHSIESAALTPLNESPVTIRSRPRIFAWTADSFDAPVRISLPRRQSR